MTDRKNKWEMRTAFIISFVLGTIAGAAAFVAIGEACHPEPTPTEATVSDTARVDRYKTLELGEEARRRTIKKYTE